MSQAGSHNDNQVLWLPVHRDALAPWMNNLAIFCQVMAKEGCDILTLCRAGNRNLRASAVRAGYICCRFPTLGIGDVELADSAGSATL